MYYKPFYDCKNRSSLLVIQSLQMKIIRKEMQKCFQHHKLRKIIFVYHESFFEYDYFTCGLYYKTFRIVIYDRNDSTIVEPVL